MYKNWRVVQCVVLEAPHVETRTHRWSLDGVTAGRHSSWFGWIHPDTSPITALSLLFQPPPSAPAAEAAQTPPPLRSTDTGARLSSVSSADLSRMASRLSDTWPFFTALISCTGHTTHSVYSDSHHDDRKHNPTTQGAWYRQPGVRSEPDTSCHSHVSELKQAAKEAGWV